MQKVEKPYVAILLERDLRYLSVQLAMNRKLSLMHLLAGVLLACVPLLSGCENAPAPVAILGNVPTSNQAAVVEGTVLLSDPDPATSHAGILVYVPGTSFQARTAQNGSYTLNLATSGAIELMAERFGYKPATVDLISPDPALHTPEKPLQVRTAILDRADPKQAAKQEMVNAQGQVFLQGQEASGGVRVQVQGTDFVTVSGEDGSYRFVNLPAGRYRFTYSRSGFLPYTTEEIAVAPGADVVLPDTALELAVANGSTTPTEELVPDVREQPMEAAKLAGDRSIAGQVTLVDEANNERTDFNQAVVAINDSDIVAEVDEQGRFLISNLPSGVYGVIGRYQGGQPVQIPVDLVNQQTASVQMRLSTAPPPPTVGTLAGRVVLPPVEGVSPPAVGARIAVAGSQLAATSGSDGTFTITDVPEGTKELVVTLEGYEALKLPGVVVTASQATAVGDLVLLPEVDNPRVVGTLPPPGTTNIPVGLDIVIQVKFNKKMNPLTVPESVVLEPPVAATMFLGQGTHPLATDENLVVVLSSLGQEKPIRFKQRYRLIIRETATDLDGIPLKQPYAMNFTTGAPGIIGTRPANGARGVYVDQYTQPVLIDFNTRLDPRTVDSDHIRVRPDNGMSVNVGMTEDPVTGWTTVRVATNWQPETNYSVTVGRGVRAANGQPLGNTPFTLRFRTIPFQVLQIPLEEVR